MAGPDGQLATILRLPSLADLLNNTALLRRLLSPVRRFQPIVSVGQRTLVTRHADVTEVMGRDEDFTVAETYGRNMDRFVGPFLLGLDRSPLYLRDKRILQQAVYPDDLLDLRSGVRSAARAAVDAGVVSGRLDVVADLAHPMTYRLVSTYLGLPGPDQATMLRWMQELFHAVFLNLTGDAAVGQAADRSAALLKTSTDDLIARTKTALAAGSEPSDTVLTRLLQLQVDPETHLSDEGIRRNVIGAMVGATETIKALAHVVDELLRHPDALADATEAARAGDMATVLAFVLEALRFNPINPILPRHVARPTVVAEGTGRERRLRAGGTIFAGLLPAMFDASVVEDPDSFRTDRPASAYLFFGHGMHRCFGERINRVQLPEILAALLAGGDLRRAPGPAGRIRKDLVSRFLRCALGGRAGSSRRGRAGERHPSMTDGADGEPRLGAFEPPHQAYFQPSCVMLMRALPTPPGQFRSRMSRSELVDSMASQPSFVNAATLFESTCLESSGLVSAWEKASTATRLRRS